MKVLCINTYAGSLLQGAMDLPYAEIIGSYEDKGFFQDVPKANFPNIDHRRLRKDWPTQDLSETVVIAHPPCSAFSVQNQGGEDVKGVDSPAFFCTRQVLDYGVANGALAICVESVMGALAGAWPVHELYARQHGYHCYRILENGCMFGCQWRERFWAVWIKAGAAEENLHVMLTPNFRTVQEVIEGHEDGPAAGNCEKLLAEQKHRLIELAECTPEEMAFFFEKQDPPHRTQALGKLLWDHKFKQPDSFPEEKWDCFVDYIGGFASNTMVFLDPNGTSPTIMAGSFWYINGRLLSEAGFKRIMGFPADYIFPDRPRNYRKDMRTGLSKGVMPPIATWLLDQLGQHLGFAGRQHSFDHPTYHLECRPDYIADFRIRKTDWPNRHAGLPTLRHFDDERHFNKGKEYDQLRSGGGLSPQVLIGAL